MPDLTRALRALLPSAVGLGQTDPQGRYPDLGPPGASPVRRAEFAAGRAAATIAMRAIGWPDAPIPMGDDRAPVWPAGLTGSISHTRTVCLAIVAPVHAASALGLDIEPEHALSPDLWDEVCLPAERRLIATAPDPAAMATLIFCAKEAVYKAQYPWTRQMFGFDRLAVVIGADHFAATFLAPTGTIPAGTVWTGRHLCADQHRIAVVHRP